MKHNWNQFHKTLLKLHFHQVDPPHGEDGFLYYESDRGIRVSIQKSNDYPDEYTNMILIRMELERKTFDILIRDD